MSGTVKFSRHSTKSVVFRKRNPNCRIRNQISAVMQVVNDLLPPNSKAFHLAAMTGEPLSSCQKMLCGARGENLEMLRALGRQNDVDFAIAVAIAFFGEDAPISRALALQRDMRKANQVLKQLKARIAE